MMGPRQTWDDEVKEEAPLCPSCHNVAEVGNMSAPLPVMATTTTVSCPVTPERRRRSHGWGDFFKPQQRHQQRRVPPPPPPGSQSPSRKRPGVGNGVFGSLVNSPRQKRPPHPIGSVSPKRKRPPPLLGGLNPSASSPAFPNAPPPLPPRNGTMTKPAAAANRDFPSRGISSRGKNSPRLVHVYDIGFLQTFISAEKNVHSVFISAFYMCF